MKKFWIALIVSLVVIIGFVIYMQYAKNISYRTYVECVEKTGLPCKYYFVGDLGHEWKPSTYHTKEECEATGAIGTTCVVPGGNFKETRWISSVDLEIANKE